MRPSNRIEGIHTLTHQPTTQTHSTVFASIYAWVQGRQYSYTPEDWQRCLVAPNKGGVGAGKYVYMYILDRDGWDGLCREFECLGGWVCTRIRRSCRLSLHTIILQTTHQSYLDICNRRQELTLLHINQTHATDDKTLFTGGAATFAMKAVVFLILSFNGVNAGMYLCIRILSGSI